MSPTDKRLLSCREAAEYLGLSEAALRKRIFLRQIKGLVRWGGRIYFDRRKLDLYIDSLELKTNGGKK